MKKQASGLVPPSRAALELGFGGFGASTALAHGDLDADIVLVSARGAPFLADWAKSRGHAPLLDHATILASAIFGGERHAFASDADVSRTLLLVAALFGGGGGGGGAVTLCTLPIIDEALLSAKGDDDGSAVATARYDAAIAVQIWSHCRPALQRHNDRCGSLEEDMSKLHAPLLLVLARLVSAESASYRSTAIRGAYDLVRAAMEACAPVSTSTPGSSSGAIIVELPTRPQQLPRNAKLRRSVSVPGRRRSLTDDGALFRKIERANGRFYDEGDYAVDEAVVVERCSELVEKGIQAERTIAANAADGDFERAKRLAVRRQDQAALRESAACLEEAAGRVRALEAIVLEVTDTLQKGLGKQDAKLDALLEIVKNMPPPAADLE